MVVMLGGTLTLTTINGDWQPFVYIAVVMIVGMGPSGRCSPPAHAGRLGRRSRSRTGLGLENRPVRRCASTGPLFLSLPGSRLVRGDQHTPVLVAMLSTSRSDACALPPNSRRPVPSTKGWIMSRYSSTRSAAINEPISTR
jgi:hypothetical protein